jgi:putative oxidoreductase
MARKLARTIGVWLVTLWLASLCLIVGTIKFTQADNWDRSFNRWGYPTWFRPVVGVAEVAAGVLVLAPPVAAYGALTMGVLMVGALGTHIVHGELNRIPPPLLLLVLSSIVLYVRRPWWLQRSMPPSGTADVDMSSTVQSR